MSPDDFSDQSPGVLTPTIFREHAGAGMTRDVAGLGFVPDPLPPNLDVGQLLVELYEPIANAERALSYLDGIASRTGNPALLMGPIQRREARLSSAIENTIASAEQMALFDVDPTAVEASKQDEVQEVNNYVRAIHAGYTADEPICLRLLKRLHAILLSNVERSAGRIGEFRDTQNAIGRAGDSFESARYVPPPPSELDRLLSDWEKFVHSTRSGLPRLVKFAIAHYQFECIHPFDDGNGRIGRLIIALQLCEQAQLTKPLVYVSGYFESRRREYYDLLYEVSARGNWNRWFMFFLDAITTQAQDTSDRFLRLSALHEKYTDAVREKRASGLVQSVVDHLFERPAVSIADVRRLTGLTAQAAGGHVKRLEEKGILVEATGRKSHRIWIAHEIIQVINS